ncbi:MAG TPA: hypothetical protein VFC09_13280 [Candidatus Dormibacteraeota bacterium]|nr:hypothetical protein [Candidatus Dormibacteraeota bacterium]
MSWQTDAPLPVRLVQAFLYTLTALAMLGVLLALGLVLIIAFAQQQAGLNVTLGLLSGAAALAVVSAPAAVGYGLGRRRRWAWLAALVLLALLAMATPAGLAAIRSVSFLWHPPRLLIAALTAVPAGALLALLAPGSRRWVELHGSAGQRSGDF